MPLIVNPLRGGPGNYAGPTTARGSSNPSTLQQTPAPPANEGGASPEQGSSWKKYRYLAAGAAFTVMTFIAGGTLYLAISTPAARDSAALDSPSQSIIQEPPLPERSVQKAKRSAGFFAKLFCTGGVKRSFCKN